MDLQPWLTLATELCQWAAIIMLALRIRELQHEKVDREEKS